jgi:hypothetical protein
LVEHQLAVLFAKLFDDRGGFGGYFYPWNSRHSLFL